MSTNDDTTMIPTSFDIILRDEHAICIDENNQGYGWLFVKHPDGQWVSLRKATDYEVFLAMRTMPTITLNARECSMCEPVEVES